MVSALATTVIAMYGIPSYFPTLDDPNAAVSFFCSSVLAMLSVSLISAICPFFPSQAVCRAADSKDQLCCSCNCCCCRAAVLRLLLLHHDNAFVPALHVLLIQNLHALHVPGDPLFPTSNRSACVMFSWPRAASGSDALWSPARSSAEPCCPIGIVDFHKPLVSVRSMRPDQGAELCLQRGSWVSPSTWA